MEMPVAWVSMRPLRRTATDGSARAQREVCGARIRVAAEDRMTDSAAAGSMMARLTLVLMEWAADRNSRAWPMVSERTRTGSEECPDESGHGRLTACATSLIQATS